MRCTLHSRGDQWKTCLPLNHRPPDGKKKVISLTESDCPLRPARETGSFQGTLLDPAWVTGLTVCLGRDLSHKFVGLRTCPKPSGLRLSWFLFVSFFGGGENALLATAFAPHAPEQLEEQQALETGWTLEPEGQPDPSETGDAAQVLPGQPATETAQEHTADSFQAGEPPDHQKWYGNETFLQRDALASAHFTDDGPTNFSPLIKGYTSLMCMATARITNVLPSSTESSALSSSALLLRWGNRPRSNVKYTSPKGEIHLDWILCSKALLPACGLEQATEKKPDHVAIKMDFQLELVSQGYTGQISYETAERTDTLEIAVEYQKKRDYLLFPEGNLRTYVASSWTPDLAPALSSQASWERSRPLLKLNVLALMPG
eukprot:3640459-Amphidinium_carterae.4